MKLKLSLVQKVFILIFIVFIIAAVFLSLLTSREIQNVFLDEQKKNVAEFVVKQANRHLGPGDFRTTDYIQAAPRFQTLLEEIKTDEIIRIKVYNTEGRVLFSDEKELIGQKLFQGEEDELKEILTGTVIADITAPVKPEHIFEQGYRQLMEIYVPIIFSQGKEVAGIVEIYFNLDFLNQKIWQTQLWFIYSITAIFVILYIFLFFIVRKASEELVWLSAELEEDILREKEYSTLKDEFISMASHQLRTPVSSIKWTTELLTAGDAGELRPKQKELVGDIYKNNQRMIDIINNLLIVSKIKSDFFRENQDFYSLGDLTGEAVAELKIGIEQKNLKLNLDISRTLPKIRVRKEALLIVLNNLIGNAIDYTSSGGKINVQIVKKGESVIFRIKDTGIGIPKDEQAIIFEKFFRARNAMEQKNVGSGLGLYIVKKIIDSYNGKIGFRSEEGRGSTFWFELPLGK